MEEKIENQDLEGRLVILSSDTKSSRKNANDMFNLFNQDHEMGSKAIRLNVNRIQYSGGRQNVEIVDPDKNLSYEQIKYMIRNSDTYFVSKLENPFLANPLKYLIDTVTPEFGKEYYQLKKQFPDEELFKKRFTSFVESSMPVDFKDVVKTETFKYKLRDISEEIYNIFKYHEDELISVIENTASGQKLDVDDDSLTMFKRTLKGYLSDIVVSEGQMVLLDELRGVTHKVGKQMLQEGDKGRLNVVLPWMDGRSDHNDNNPNEAIRVLEDADMLKNHNVSSIYMTNQHSFTQEKMLRDAGIDVHNLTQTNEYISLLCQNRNIDFKKLYVLAPDKGSVEDAMVFARELYRRTHGEFSGRVVVLDKKRSGPEEIEEISFKSSFIYQKDNEYPEDLRIKDKRGHSLPYDMTHKENYKNPESDKYVGRLFKKDYDTDNLDELKKIIKGHTGLFRDDIFSSTKTLDKAAREVFKEFKSKIYAMGEHGSFTGDAFELLTELYNDGILEHIYVSTNIYQPSIKDISFITARTMFNRYKTTIKEEGFMPFLEENFKPIFTRLKKYSTTK